MTFNYDNILSAIQTRLDHSDRWRKKLSKTDFTLHLGIFREPYLTYIMEGKKTIETRFAKRACPPYKRVAKGDVVLMKPVGGRVAGICEIDQVWFYQLDPDAVALIKDRFGEMICPADGSFWTERESKNVATLMLVKNVTVLSGIEIEKRDRRGWVTFHQERELSLFNQ